MTVLHVGLIINPVAGIGGQLALKGSDGEEAWSLANQLEGPARASDRASRALQPLLPVCEQLRFSTWAGAMGADLMAALPFQVEELGEGGKELSHAKDTVLAAAALKASGVDLLVFVGGDGTARDVFDALGDSLPVLGIPAGVKMHSGVFAVSPEAAGELMLQLVQGGLVGIRLQEVRDIDEEAFRAGRVSSRFYGEMPVPGEGRFLQHTKVAGRESAELVTTEIGAWLVENMIPGTLYLLGPGSTTAAIMVELGLDYTLLGVDIVQDGKLLLADADEQALLQFLDQHHNGKAEIIITAIGGQGHILGRGNQQLSPAVLKKVGLDNITVAATKSKIADLQGRPLLVDSNDPDLDAELIGFRSVITGYDDQILYRIDSPTG